MTKKKRRELEAAAAFEAQMQKEAAMREEEKRRQKTVTVRKPVARFMIMNNSNPVPVAKPADFIQLTPIVQPVPIVPYSTQLQPLAMFDMDDDE